MPVLPMYGLISLMNRENRANLTVVNAEDLP